ncbi:unnamed protein product [Cercospora beticola]|nr:unnamed protein product [Cercospora beticola]
MLVALQSFLFGRQLLTLLQAITAWLCALHKLVSAVMHHSGFAMMTVPTRRAEHGMKDSSHGQRQRASSIWSGRDPKSADAWVVRSSGQKLGTEILFCVVQELSAATDLPAHGVGLTSLAEANQGPRR